MIKKIKNLKKVFLKKKFLIKINEKIIIQKSFVSNFKNKNLNRIVIQKKKKKKIISKWQNCCFTLGLFKKQWSKFNMSRFTVKRENFTANIVGVKVKTW